jgi:hypothetical protein
METLKFKTNINCGGCVAKVTPILDEEKQIHHWHVDTADVNKILTVQTDALAIENIRSLVAKAGFLAEPVKSNYISEQSHHITDNFWLDLNVWKKASLNTTNCLIGCSIGDFGVIIYLQMHFHKMDMFLMMGLAMIAGLTTSVILETVLLKINEKFDWLNALKTAFGMSFLSMLAMELAENTTDYFLTGGQVPTSDPFYWIALSISLIAGFIVPLPYNYYKLKKHGKACH